MECSTEGCIKPGRYLIINDRRTERYCLVCIQKIKEREHSQ